MILGKSWEDGSFAEHGSVHQKGWTLRDVNALGKMKGSSESGVLEFSQSLRFSLATS